MCFWSKSNKEPRHIFLSDLSVCLPSTCPQDMWKINDQTSSIHPLNPGGSGTAIDYWCLVLIIVECPWNEWGQPHFYGMCVRVCVCVCLTPCSQHRDLHVAVWTRVQFDLKINDFLWWEWRPLDLLNASVDVCSVESIYYWRTCATFVLLTHFHTHYNSYLICT